MRRGAGGVEEREEGEQEEGEQEEEDEEERQKEEGEKEVQQEEGEGAEGPGTGGRRVQRDRAVRRRRRDLSPPAPAPVPAEPRHARPVVPGHARQQLAQAATSCCCASERNTLTYRLRAPNFSGGLAAASA
jgi:hypothetical protein